MNEKPVRLAVPLTVAPESGGDGFTFLPGVHKHQTFFAPGVLKDIADARIRVFRGVVGFFVQYLHCGNIRPIFGGLHVLHVKMLHAEPPFDAFGINFWDICFSSGAGGKKRAGTLRVADGGGEADPPGIYPRQPGQPFNETQGLSAPVSPQEGVHLVNDHKAQVGKEPGNGSVLVQQQGFQRFRRDLQDTGGVLHELFLVALGYVSVPVPDRNVRLGAQLVQPQKLVVDKCFQRTDINAPDGSRGIFGKQGNDGEEGRLRFSGRCRRGEQHVILRIEDRVRCRNLNGTQIFPVVAVNIFLYKRCIPVKSAHGSHLLSAVTVPFPGSQKFP